MSCSALNPLGQRPMLRRLLNIASIVYCVACVVFMGLWVRSYYRCDFVTNQLVTLGSNSGHVYRMYDTVFGSTANGQLSEIVSTSGKLEVFHNVTVLTKDMALIRPWSIQSVPRHVDFPMPRSQRMDSLLTSG